MTLLQTLSLFGIAIQQRLMTQTLDRTPETTMLMDSDEQVRDYHHAGQTTLDLIYCLAVELIHPWFTVDERRAIDLGCGPANAARRLIEGLNLDYVVAIDGSYAMLEQARQNAMDAGISQLIEFREADLRHLHELSDNSFTLSCCILTAHHLSDLNSVRMLLADMERITQSAGVCFLLDLARLKSRKLVDQYVRIFADGQSDLHNEDFRSSMLAAFTPQELAAAVPPNYGKGTWRHFLSPIVPALQVIMRTPVGISPRADVRWLKSPVTWISNRHWRGLSNGFLANSRTAR